VFDNPFQSPASVEFRTPNPVWRVPWLKIAFWVAVLFVLAALFLPQMRRGGGRQSAYRSACFNNLSKIGQAIKAYHDEHQVYPPAYTVDANGNPLHSWRTLILPYLGEEALYKTIDLTKPWKDPVNAQALQTQVNTYQCAAADLPLNHTGYLAIVTPQSCLRPGKSATKQEQTDDPDKTALVVEVPHEKSVPWMSPNDADETLFVDQMRDTKQTANWPHMGTSNVLFVAGNTQAIDVETPAAERRAMITIAGGD
jgi:hypothetical protein